MLLDRFVTALGESTVAAWLESWIAFDRKHTALEDAVCAMDTCGPCPATPQAPWATQVPNNAGWWWAPVSSIAQFWTVWDSTGLLRNSPHAKVCYQLRPGWFAATKYGVRCCYDESYDFIPHWPSRVLVHNEWASPVLASVERNAERLACGRDSSANWANDSATQSASCLAFAARRPAPPSVQNPFATGYCWTPRRRRGGGFGDPHCSTTDGLQYPCNFAGEALWTSCGAWKVHVVGTPAGAGNGATVLTQLAVSSGNDTAVVLVGSGGSNTTGRNFRVFMNDASVLTTSSGTSLTVEVDNERNTVTVTDTAGHEVEALVNATRLSLTVATADSCRGNATGLLGNNNGDATDDLRVKGSATALDHTLATSDEERVYDEVVMSYLITDQAASVFPRDYFVQGNTTYRPQFTTQAMLDNCPSACNADRGCCFDFAVGGQDFLDAYLSEQATQTSSSEGAVAFDANFPPNVQGPTLINQGDASSTPVELARFNATDSDTIASFECTACPSHASYDATAMAAYGIQCEKSGLNTATATIVITGYSLPTGVFSCNATDAHATPAMASARTRVQADTDVAEDDSAASATSVAPAKMSLLVIVVVAVIGLVLVIAIVACVKKGCSKKNDDADDDEDGSPAVGRSVVYVDKNPTTKTAAGEELKAAPEGAASQDPASGDDGSLEGIEL